MSKEVKLVINNVTYEENVIFSLSTHRAAFSDFSKIVGNCVSGELYAVVNIPSASIPRNAEIKPYIRENNGAWVQKSTFYVFSREVDKITGYVTLTAYDAIFRTEQSFTQSGNQGSWPRKDIAVMQEIATRTNSTISSDALAIIVNNYDVQYPGITITDGTTTTYKPDGQGALTMRDVAGRIAAMYGGSWFIDNNGQWRLWQLGVMPVDADYLVTESHEIIVMGGVRILVK